MAKENTAKRSARVGASLRVISGGGNAMDTGPFDRIIHERMRLAIVSALAVNTTLTFNELKDILGASDGNLSVHTQKLEEAGYVACDKSYDGRKPKSTYRLTREGRQALDRYLSHMESLIASVREK